MLRPRLVWLGSLAVALAACASEGDRDAAPLEPAVEPAVEPAIVEPAIVEPAIVEPAAILAEAASPGCPEDMALVEGDYCPAVQQQCVAYQETMGAKGPVRGQCKQYAAPTVCLAPRTPVRFCMDRYEWPNRKGEPPRTLTSWQDAKKMCLARDKRLCTENEFNFACEGEAMLPFVYGYERDATKCNFDRPYRERTFAFTPWDACLADERCRAAFEAIDQRVPAGSMETCRSEDGVHDLIGNANEWVLIPDAKSPHRSGLKGGWWGPVRDRCRPTVTFHDEGDHGYEVGFRCCADASAGGEAAP